MDEINNPILWSICKAARIGIVKATGIIANVVLGIGVIGGLIAVIVGLLTNTEHFGYRPEWIIVGFIPRTDSISAISNWAWASSSTGISYTRIFMA